MSAQIIPLPVRKREPNEGLARSWLYSLMVNNGHDEAFAREVSQTLAPSIRTLPSDIAKMEADLAG